MNKKTVSLVLAMCLSVGLGVSSVFASLRNANVSESYEAANAGSYGWSVKDASGTVTGSETKSGFQIKVGSAEDKLSGALSGVFSYYAGIMTGYNQTGGSYTIYDSYGARAMLQSTDNKTFTLESFSFRTSDLANMPPDGASSDTWNSYLKGLGFNEGSLSRMAFNEDGTPKGLNKNGSGKVESQNMNASLFQCLKDNLAQGLNYGVSLAMGDGATGMSITLTEDGKTYYTLTSYDSTSATTDPTPVKLNGKEYSGLRVVSEVTYDNNGLQTGSKTYGFEFDSTDANSGNTQLGVGGKWVVNETKIHYDENNIRYDVTYKTDLKGNNLNGDIKTSHYNSKDLGISENAVKGIGNAISVITYTANGSRYASVDGTTGNISRFVDDKISFTRNSDNTIVANYYRAENGVLLSSWQSDGTADADNAGKKGGTTTVYSYYGETPIAVFNDVNGDKYFGSTAKAEQTIATAEKFKNEVKAGKYPALKDEFADIKNVYWTQNELLTLKANGSKLFSADQIDNMIRFSNGTGVVAKTDIKADTWNKLPDNAVMAGNVTTGSRSGGTHTQWSTLDAEYTGYTLTSTIMLGGSAAYEVKCNVVTSGSVTLESDPAVSGKLFPPEGTTDEEIENMAKEILGDDYDSLSDEEKAAVMEDLKNGFITKDGKTYAIVVNAEMNILDGSGFHSANGEAILVEVNNEQKERIKNNVSESRDVMFMGNVASTDVNGHLAIAMEDSYGGGFISGTAEEINDAKNEMDTVINAVKDFKDGFIDQKTYNEIIKKAEGDDAGKYGWLVDNTNDNLSVFKQNGFSWSDEDDNKRQLIKAFELLF